MSTYLNWYNFMDEIWHNQTLSFWFYQIFREANGTKNYWNLIEKSNSFFIIKVLYLKIISLLKLIFFKKMAVLYFFQYVNIATILGKTSFLDFEDVLEWMKKQKLNKIDMLKVASTIWIYLKLQYNLSLKRIRTIISKMLKSFGKA